jgi:hypothetical protein
MFGEATVARRKAATTPRKRRPVNRPLMPVVGSPTESADYKTVSGRVRPACARPEVSVPSEIAGVAVAVSLMSCSASCSNAGPALITKPLCLPKMPYPQIHSQPQRIRIYRFLVGTGR